MGLFLIEFYIHSLSSLVLLFPGSRVEKLWPFKKPSEGWTSGKLLFYTKPYASIQFKVS